MCLAGTFVVGTPGAFFAHDRGTAVYHSFGLLIHVARTTFASRVMGMMYDVSYPAARTIKPHALPVMEKALTVSIHLDVHHAYGFLPLRARHKDRGRLALKQPPLKGFQITYFLGRLAMNERLYVASQNARPQPSSLLSLVFRSPPS